MKGRPAVVLSHQEVDCKRQNGHMMFFGEGDSLCSDSDMILI
jgi:hypothetical protein